MNKKNFPITIIVILVLVIIAFIILSFLPKEEGEEFVNILTNKQEYEPGDILKVKIENSTKDSICLSSCYPYYIQKKNGDRQWKDYRYEGCDTEDIIENCIEPRSIKAFEFTIPEISQGEHRLLVSACAGCSLRERFERNKNLISNYFTIK